MPIHPATNYALKAVEKKITTGRWERLACLRHLYDLGRAGQLTSHQRGRVQRATGRKAPTKDRTFPWVFDGKQASLVAVDWFRALKHVEGPLAGEPIELVPAHIFDISMIYGWVHRTRTITKANGRQVGLRRYTKAFVFEARKNAKTTRGAGIGLYSMAGDSEESPAVYCTAVDRKQARVLYNYSKRMAEKSPHLCKRLKIGKYEMSHKYRGGEMTAFSGDVKNKDGFNCSTAFIDEYHRHPTNELLTLMEESQVQRAQPLTFIITTAGYDVESPCFKEYEYCKLVLEGAVSEDPNATKNEHYYIAIRELDEGDDEHDPANWIKANPLRASTKDGLAKLQQQHDEAFGSGIPSKIKAFRVKVINKWVHGNENTYLGDYMLSDGVQKSKWDQAAVSREKFLELTKGMLCLVGADMSKRIDLTALAYVFALEDGRVAISAHGFMPEGAVDKHERTDQIPYRQWARAGWLTITDGDVTDYSILEEQIRLIDGSLNYGGELNAQMLDASAAYDKKLAYHYAIGNGWRVHEICYDPYDATHFKNNMDAHGYQTIEVRQTMAALNEPTKELRYLLADGKIIHDGSPLLKWCAGNAQEIVNTKENIMISKKNTGDTRRIDLLAATIDALYRIQPLFDFNRLRDDIGV